MPQFANQANETTSKPKYDPDFTRNVINATGPRAHPRLAQLVASLTQHLHDFARENDLTVAEWMQGVQMLNRAGQMSNDRRNEMQLVCDVLGIESLVDEITNKLASGADFKSTRSAILGPFFRHDTPLTPNGASIIKNMPSDGEITYMHGVVRDAATKKPLSGISIDIWQCSTNGLYEQQDSEQTEFNLRGKFTTAEDGSYSLYCLRPIPYPVPDDGPAGELLKLLDRHPFRPAHIHILAGDDNHEPLTTQIFDRNSKYLIDDSVFAVQEELIVDFKPVVGKNNATLDLEYNIDLIAKKS